MDFDRNEFNLTNTRDLLNDHNDIESDGLISDGEELDTIVDTPTPNMFLNRSNKKRKFEQANKIPIVLKIAVEEASYSTEQQNMLSNTNEMDEFFGESEDEEHQELGEEEPEDNQNSNACNVNPNFQNNIYHSSSETSLLNLNHNAHFNFTSQALNGVNSISKTQNSRELNLMNQNADLSLQLNYSKLRRSYDLFDRMISSQIEQLYNFQNKIRSERIELDKLMRRQQLTNNTNIIAQKEPCNTPQTSSNLSNNNLNFQNNASFRVNSLTNCTIDKNIYQSETSHEFSNQNNNKVSEIVCIDVDDDLETKNEVLSENVTQNESLSKQATNTASEALIQTVPKHPLSDIRHVIFFL
jgi:hypothetical protein